MRFSKLNSAILSSTLLGFLTLVSGQTSGPLHACSYYMYKDGVKLPVYRSGRVGTYSEADQCLYNAGTFNGTCHYDRYSYFLITDDVDNGFVSDPGCWNPLPRAVDAGTFSIMDSHSTVCLTAGGTSTPLVNGTPVHPNMCDGRHGYPLQAWTFDGLRIRQGNFCLDVTDGNTANGAKLQMWECIEGNVNQMFTVQEGDLLALPENVIQWKTHPEKCVDLTDGQTTGLVQTQLWDCVQFSGNQAWNIRPAYYPAAP